MQRARPKTNKARKDHERIKPIGMRMDLGFWTYENIFLVGNGCRLVLVLIDGHQFAVDYFAPHGFADLS
jgi:hypothetical protein